jgi:hypothetical protein
MVSKPSGRKKGEPLSLKEYYGEDAEEVKAILVMFSSEGKRDAEIINPGERK